MNREYNDNKMYNSALDELRFSEEAKSRMVDRLMAAAEQPEQPVAIHRVRRFPRIAAVGVAAALVLSIGAGATGVFKSASDAFALRIRSNSRHRNHRPDRPPNRRERYGGRRDRHRGCDSV